MLYFRLAIRNMSYLSDVLVIRNPIHKRKIMLKAIDVILFGAPRCTFAETFV